MKYVTKNNQFNIFCDMDGVLTNFEKSAKQLDSNIFNISQEEAWKKVQNANIEFWSKMDWTKDGKELWNYLIDYNPKILTALPGLSDNDPNKLNATKGKRIWVTKNLGNNYLKKLILTTSLEKEKYATSNSILIDDTKKLIDQWENKGGIGILHKNSNDTINKLRKLL